MPYGTESRSERRSAIARFNSALYRAVLCGLALVASAAAQSPDTLEQSILVLSIEGAIGPSAAEYFDRGLARATEAESPLLILQLDTPGGLDVSMRQIIKRILSAPIPIAVYVTPSGAHAASAGTFILYASHVAAMAPGTNVGAATPVNIGAPQDAQPTSPPSGDSTEKTLARKQAADAAAYIRSLAQLRGRNVEWAEQAVVDAASVSAQEALRLGVIDLIATDIGDLVRQLEGRTVRMPSGEVELSTTGVPLTAFQPDWRTRLLAVITNPQIALILMMLGIYGLFFELTSPGFGVAGVGGAVCLILALYGLHMLPVNYAGLALVMFGIVLMAAEAFYPGFGVLGFGGAIAFIVGAVILIETEAPGFGIPLSLIVAIAIVSMLLLSVVGGAVLRARRRPVVSGRESLQDAIGEVIVADGGRGTVRVSGELWNAESATPLIVGAQVRVRGVQGLTLQVEMLRLSSGPLGEPS